MSSSSAYTKLVKCGKCAFSFHNHGHIDTCPRCGGQLNPNINLIQGSVSNSKGKNLSKQLEDLQKILYDFTGLRENNTLRNVPIGISPIDKDFTQSKPSKRVQQGSIISNTKQITEDLDRVLREFA